MNELFTQALVISGLIRFKLMTEDIDQAQLNRLNEIEQDIQSALEAKLVVYGVKSWTKKHIKFQPKLNTAISIEQEYRKFQKLL